MRAQCPCLCATLCKSLPNWHKTPGELVCHFDEHILDPSRCRDVGVDANRYAPVAAGEALRFFEGCRS